MPFLPLENKDFEEKTPQSSLQFLVSFIEKKEEKPKIITNDWTLTTIACGGAVDINVFRKSDLIFLWMTEEKNEEKENENILKTFFTERTETKRTVFKAKVPIGRDYCSVLYSGEADPVDDKNQTYSFRVTSSATSTFDFWDKKSSNFFWKAVFGMTPMVVIGTRTGEKEKDPKTRPPLNYPELSVYKLEKLPRDSIPGKANEYSLRPRSTFVSWSLVDGEARIQNFMKMVKDTVEGDSFVLRRNEGAEEWKKEEAVEWVW
uniref:Decapping nuclease n=1 Tax=Caenorhabditis tropicalis TaxID=1561998 RepID=A0A1I7TU94_9PELO